MNHRQKVDHKSVTRLLFCLLFYFVALSLSACQMSVTNEQAPVAISPDSKLELELFSARGAFSRSEYEHFKLTGDSLWRECGTLAKAKKSSAESAPELTNITVAGNKELTLTQKDQAIKILPENTLASIRSQSQQVLTHLSSKSIIPPAGSATSFATPGVVELKLTVGDKSQTLTTSLDALSADSGSVDTLGGEVTALLKSAQDLYKLLRGASDEPDSCDSPMFFGIGRTLP